MDSLSDSPLSFFEDLGWSHIASMSAKPIPWLSNSSSSSSTALDTFSLLSESPEIFVSLEYLLDLDEWCLLSDFRCSLDLPSDFSDFFSLRESLLVLEVDSFLSRLDDSFCSSVLWLRFLFEWLFEVFVDDLLSWLDVLFLSDSECLFLLLLLLLLLLLCFDVSISFSFSLSFLEDDEWCFEEELLRSLLDLLCFDDVPATHVSCFELLCLWCLLWCEDVNFWVLSVVGDDKFCVASSGCE